MYCTLVQLADAKLARELAQAATPERLRIPADEVMDAVLRGADTTAMDPDDVAAAQAAVVVIGRALDSADALIDGYLATRGYALPLQLSPTSTGKSMLTVWARAIARYLLNGSRITDESKDPVARDYRDALKRLADVAAGKLSLGGTDPQAPANATSTDVRFDSAPAVFGRHELRHFR